MPQTLSAVGRLSSFRRVRYGRFDCIPTQWISHHVNYMPKPVDTRRHYKVYVVESMEQSSATSTPHIHFWRLREIVACSQPYLLVSTVFGTVSSLHPISFLHFYVWPRVKRMTRKINCHDDSQIFLQQASC